MLIKLRAGRALAWRIVFQRREPPVLIKGRWVYGRDVWPILFRSKDDAWRHLHTVDAFRNTRHVFRGRRGQARLGQCRYASVTVEPVTIPIARAILKWGPLGDPVC